MKELDIIAKEEAFANNAAEARYRINQQIDGEMMQRGTVMSSTGKGKQYLVISGHALDHARNDRASSRTEIQKMAERIFANDDATWELMGNTVELLRNTLGVGSESGKTATVVEVENEDLVLVIETFTYGYRIASIWNFAVMDERPYGLQDHDDYLLIKADGSVTHKMSERFKRFQRKRRAI